VVLERKNGKHVVVPLAKLSAEDRDFLAALPQATGDTRIEGIQAQPGIVSPRIACLETPDWSYHLYLPNAFHDGRKWPVWFVMSPGGGTGGDALTRYIGGAERLGCVLALSVESKNDFADSDIAMEAMADDVFKRLPVLDGLAFATGFSGGSRMAFLLAERDKRIAGVLACGSGSGVYLKEKDFRQAELRRSTYVYSLIGSNCFNRTEAYRSHKNFPEAYRLRFFPGGHSWADSPLIAEGMARVLGEALRSGRGEPIEKLRLEYARTVLSWTQDLAGAEPWEAHSWATFLKDFPGDRTIQTEAETLASKLASDPRVGLAQDADRAIQRFTSDYFDLGDYKVDQQANPTRSADADALAEKYSDIPHGDLIRQLGGSS
jgi:hypothetical protein